MGQHDPTDEELYPETQDDDEEAAPPAEEPEYVLTIQRAQTSIESVRVESATLE